MSSHRQQCDRRKGALGLQCKKAESLFVKNKWTGQVMWGKKDITVMRLSSRALLWFPMSVRDDGAVPFTPASPDINNTYRM